MLPGPQPMSSRDMCGCKWGKRKVAELATVREAWLPFLREGILAKDIGLSLLRAIYLDCCYESPFV